MARKNVSRWVNLQDRKVEAVLEGDEQDIGRVILQEAINSRVEDVDS